MYSFSASAKVPATTPASGGALYFQVNGTTQGVAFANSDPGATGAGSITIMLNQDDKVSVAAFPGVATDTLLVPALNQFSGLLEYSC